MADKKKPVWVDQDAHTVLKTYAKLMKKSMVEVASELVLARLEDLSPDAGLEADSSETDTDDSSDAAPAPKKRRASSKPRLTREDRSVRYLGGVWLI